MNEPVEPTIVVGVSGSPASARALGWAAEETARLHSRLKIVLIWSVDQRAFYAPAINADDFDRRQARAVAGLAATVRAVLGSEPPDGMTAEVAQGMAERALVQQSLGADLLVLGSASGLVAGRSIGPVIRACLSHAHCPVVVVGPEGPRSHGRPGQGDRQPTSVTTLDRSGLLLAAAAAGPGLSAPDGGLR